MVEIVGEQRYERGRMSTIVTRLASLTRLNGTTRVIVSDPTGSEANLVRDAVDYRPAFDKLLGSNGVPTQVNAPRQVPAWSPTASSADAQEGAALPI